MHEEILGYNALLDRFQKTPEDQWEGLVSASRPDLKLEFFTHINVLVQAKHVGCDRTTDRIADRIAYLYRFISGIVGRISHAEQPAYHHRSGWEIGSGVPVLLLFGQMMWRERAP